MGSGGVHLILLTAGFMGLPGAVGSPTPGSFHQSPPALRAPDTPAHSLRPATSARSFRLPELSGGSRPGNLSGGFRLQAEGSAPPPGTPVLEERHASVAAALARLGATDLEGRRWTAADLQGRVVLLDFWATWCAPCLADLPLLARLRAKHSRADFEILGISLDVMSRRAFVSWIHRNRVDWPQVHERSGYAGEVPRLFGIAQLPSTILLGRDGRPAAIDERGERLAAIADALVEKRAECYVLGAGC